MGLVLQLLLLIVVLGYVDYQHIPVFSYQVAAPVKDKHLEGAVLR